MPQTQKARSSSTPRHYNLGLRLISPLSRLLPGKFCPTELWQCCLWALSNLALPIVFGSETPVLLKRFNTSNEELLNVMTRILHAQEEAIIDDLLDTDLLFEMTQAYYQRLGAQAIRFGYTTTDNSSTIQGVAVRNENRLIVQIVPMRIMDGLLAAIIVLASYILVSLRIQTSLPFDPARLAGLLLILKQQPWARTMFLHTGYFGEEQLQQKLQQARGVTPNPQSDEDSQGVATTVSDWPNDTDRQDGERKIHHKVLVRKWWRPLTITIWIRSIMFLLTILIIVALQVLLRYSRSKHGLANVPVRGQTHLAWSIVPASAMVFLGIYFRALGFCYKTFSPYCRLRQDDTARPLFINYLTSTEIEVLASSIEDRQYAIISLATASLISAFLTIVMSGVWSAQSVPSTQQVLLNQDTWFFNDSVTDEGEVGNNAYLSSLILGTNASYPSWTHGEFALGSVSLRDNPSTMAEAEQTIRTDLPAIRASLNCTIYDQTQIPDLTFVAVAGANGSRASLRSYSVRLELPGPPACAEGTHHYIHPSAENTEIGWFDYFNNTQEDCPILSYVWGRWDTSKDEVAETKDVGYATALSCSESIEQVQIDTTLSYPGLSIATNEEPRVLVGSVPRRFSTKKMALPYENLSEMSRVSGDSSLPVFAGALLQHYGITVADFSDPEKSTVVAEAIQSAHKIIRAQQYNGALERQVDSLSNELGPITAELINANRYRLVQNAISTHILSALLAIMLICAALSSWLMSTNYVLPKNPCSIAAIVSLLADSNILDDEVLLQELRGELAKRPWRSRRSNMGARKFRMGWFDEPGSREQLFTINQLGAAEAR